jgi:hypothetical protein
MALSGRNQNDIKRMRCSLRHRPRHALHVIEAERYAAAGLMQARECRDQSAKPLAAGHRTPGAIVCSGGATVEEVRKRDQDAHRRSEPTFSLF